MYPLFLLGIYENQSLQLVIIRKNIARLECLQKAIGIVISKDNELFFFLNPFFFLFHYTE